MKIIIAGAGDVGFHLASLLSKESQDIYLIDQDREKLEYAANHLDVYTVVGDSTNPNVLKEARVSEADLVIAVTDRQATNILSGAVSKKLGAGTVVARVQNQAFLKDRGVFDLSELGIDSAIAPRDLLIQEIGRLLQESVATDVFEFDDGALSIYGIVLGKDSPLAGATTEDDSLREQRNLFRPIAVQRGQRTYIPYSSIELKEGDHIYFLTKPDGVEIIAGLSGTPTDPLRNVMILGGGQTGEMCARRLQHKYEVKLVEKNRQRCEELASMLKNVLVIHADARDVDALEDEGLEQVDAFVSLTGDSETNIISCLVAKNHGVRKTVALVENIDYISITQNIGIDSLINRKLIAANNIFRYVRRGRVDAITSLHGVNAEIIEFTAALNSRITKKDLVDINFPPGSLIGGIIRNGEVNFGEPDFRVKVGDHVIVFCLPSSISAVERLFS